MEKNSSMAKKPTNGSILFLRLALIGVAGFVIFLCALMFPVYWKEDVQNFRYFVTALYIAALPFFYALYQAWMLLALIDKNQAFSEPAVRMFGAIKNCGAIISVLFILYTVVFGESDPFVDPPGIFVFTALVAFLSTVIAGFAAIMQKVFENALNLQKENDLTV
jgi:hypothetical protein